MRKILLLLAAFATFTSGVVASAAEREAPGDSLARSSKGVCIAKLKNGEALCFVFFGATNRVRRTSSLQHEPARFSTFEAAIAFTGEKLRGSFLSPVTVESIIDDALILLTMTDAEQQALIEAAAPKAQAAADPARSAQE